LKLSLVAEGMGPLTDATGRPNSDIILVTEKEGRVLSIENGEVRSEPFIDLTDSVLSAGNEQGLVTIALHPRFTENGRVYLFFTDLEGDSQLVEVRADPSDLSTALSGARRPILTIPQDQQYHQSGSITFGPDGLLWLSIGDGGGIGDPHGYGQDPGNLYGTLVRLDIDAASPYAIPSSNPYVGSGDEGRLEVWAYGLRNPWRVSIDEATGLVYVPDVGQDGSEEINVVPIAEGGHNFGWSISEGSECFEAEGCDLEGQTLPALEYLHEGRGCAIVGGDVYRGEAIPELQGHYFFGDYCSGWVRSVAFVDGEVTMEHDWEEQLGKIPNLTSFGTDGNGEILITNLQGELWRLNPAGDGG
jgi:glucose/arabinose dehydrogenase